ncbi:MAG: Phospho-N-acetylmuramoyl-pentapeptide-transferase [Candidatus Dichloromethanomonas elyunquensis]|nr:MAG: Phospho-N-acetylmuramoyl-pentapeptide-transferase [Candidatus Dichloromethanomonas elyunquensis]
MAERIFFSAGIALLVSLLVGPFLIPVLRVLKFGQSIRDDGPQRHLSKAGTPTIGGLIFLAGIAAAVLFMAKRPYSLGILSLLGITLGFGLVGFLDDFLKVLRKKNLGLRAKQKLAAEFLLALLLAWVSAVFLGRGTVIGIPFTSIHIDLGAYYYPLVALVVVSATNAVNLTDGLDGLAAGCTAFAAVGYIFISLLAVQAGLLQGAAVYADDLTIFAAALTGGCLGFLRFNLHPARVFMGDCGSLALGGALAGLAVLSKSELVLIILGGVYVLEALSVIIQVISFQTRGKRIFRMSPVHHHFELGGWSEKKVVTVFWMAAAFFAMIGVYAFLLMIP